MHIVLTFSNAFRAGYVNLRRHSYRSCGRPLPGEKRQVLGYVCDPLPLFGGRLGSAQRGTYSVLYFPHSLQLVPKQKKTHTKVEMGTHHVSPDPPRIFATCTI